MQMPKIDKVSRKKQQRTDVKSRYLVFPTKSLRSKRRILFYRIGSESILSCLRPFLSATYSVGYILTTIKAFIIFNLKSMVFLAFGFQIALFRVRLQNCSLITSFYIPYWILLPSSANNQIKLHAF